MGFGGSGGGSSSIGGSTDVSLNELTAKEVLGYDGSNSVWTNMSAALGNGGGQELFKTINTSGSVALNLADGNVQNVQLTGNTTFTSFDGAVENRACSFGLYLQQDGTGGRTVTWPSSVKWSEGQVPTLTTTANSLDILVFESLDGGDNWHGSLVGTNFKQPA